MVSYNLEKRAAALLGWLFTGITLLILLNIG